MANVIEVAKAAVTAYNKKDWNELGNLLAANAVYDEKATNRRLEGSGQIIEALQGWAQAFPDSKGTLIREFASSDAAAVPRSAKSKLRWSHLGWATSKAIIGGTKINNDCTCSDKTTTAKRRRRIGSE